MKTLSMYFNFLSFEQTYKKYYKYDVPIIYTQWKRIYKLRLKKIRSPDMHTSGTNSMFHQRILVSDTVFTYIILRCRDIYWNMFRMTKMKNKALQYVSNIFWENFLSAHNRHRKKIFCIVCFSKNHQNFSTDF